MADKLTKKQEEVLVFIKDQILKKGYPPTVRDICEGVNLRSTSSVHSHLNTLEEKGYIVITFYIGHEGGKDEYYLLSGYMKEKRFQIIETYSQNKIDSPVTYIIRKPQSSTSA